MKNLVNIGILLFSLLIISCDSQPSLQQYFVNHQDDKDFISADFASSLIDTQKISLSDEEEEALSSIKKVNILALPIKEGLNDKYQKEKKDIKTILKDESYQTLMKFGSNGINAVLKYQGADDDIDEVIVFASQNEKGLALVRILGDDMQPEKMMKLAKAVEKKNLDLSALKNVVDSFDF